MRRLISMVLGMMICVFCGTVDAEVGWEEDFEPIKITWVATTAYWTDLAGPTATITENDPAAAYGVVASETITLDLSQYSQLVITSTAVDTDANYSVQIQEVGGAEAYADAASWITQPGTQIVDIAALMGWSGTKSFVINVYIDGESKSATFERFEVREPAGWVEEFDPLKITWTHEETYWTDTVGPGATLTEDSNDLNVRWWGAAYAETITVDLDVYNTLYVDVDSVESGCRYTVQIEEMEGVGAAAEAITLSTATGETAVNIPNLMSWSGVKTFRVVIWLDAGNGGRDVSFNSIAVDDGTLVVVEGWLEDFDPIKPTWANDGTYWTDTAGPGAILTEASDPNDPDVWWGVAHSEAIIVDANEYSILYVQTTAVETGCMYTIQIEEIGGDSGVADAVSLAGSPGLHIIDIAALMGWNDVRSFRINIWLDSGLGGRDVTFGEIELRSSSEALAPIFWQDHFDPIELTQWIEMGAYWTDLPNSNATLTEDNPGLSYGKVESVTLTVNMDVYPELTVVIPDVEDGGSTTIGIQEQGDDWSYRNVISDVTDPNEPGIFKANIADEMGWSGYQTFRIVIWIDGNGNSATFDLVRIGMDCGTDVLPGDYCEDCFVDLKDLAFIANSWLDEYDMLDLVDIANYWLQE
jgi:hypothetical protein